MTNKLKEEKKQRLSPLRIGSIIVGVVIILFMLFSIFVLVTGYTRAQAVTPTIHSSALQTVNPDLPIEFYENADQTVGIALGGVVLVLIIVGGTLLTMKRRR